MEITGNPWEFEIYLPCSTTILLFLIFQLSGSAESLKYWIYWNFEEEEEEAIILETELDFFGIGAMANVKA